MKVLLVHNFYQSSSPSGEDVVYQNEKELLASRGVEVITYERFNDDISSKAKAALSTIWSAATYNELKLLISREKPDIAHFHNIWYLISPSAYAACGEAGVPVIQTLHNFRMFCVSGLLMREGKVCEECVGKVPWRSVAYGCYRNSRLYSVPVAMTESFHRIRRTWTDKIDTYIALTEFGKQKFVQCGLPEEKIFVKPNFLANPPDMTGKDEGYAVFLGRLSSEKGITILIDAIRLLQATTSEEFSLKIIGDGKMRKSVEERITSLKLENITIMGRKIPAESLALLKRASFLIMPSVWYEGFPMVIAEAFACGKPVVGSNLGAMASIIRDGETGLLFQPGNAEDLASKISWMIGNKDACIQMGRNARSEFESKYTADRNFEMLMDIYRKAISVKRS